MKVKGLAKGVKLCELERGDAFAFGGAVYVRCYEYLRTAKVGEDGKVNAFHLEHGKLYMIPWQSEVVPVELKAKVEDA